MHLHKTKGEGRCARGDNSVNYFFLLLIGEGVFLYIDYEKIGESLGFGKNIFYNLKVKQNIDYIKKNQKEVLKKLRNKKPLNVLFYVYDESKWKSQSVYDLMEKDDRFNPFIVVTKNCAPKGNANEQTIDDIKKCYEFFENKGMKVKYGYDITGRILQKTSLSAISSSVTTEDGGFIPFEMFAPDIIIYSHPWYVYKTQGPVVCSKFALTYYIPYFIPASEQWHEYGLRFHQYIYKHYVPTDLVKEFYSKNMQNKGKSLRVVGHPILDEYLKKEKSLDSKTASSIIYAPHWTVCGNNLRFGTFDWSGYKILEFAKSHPELNWIFRPHPLLYNFVITSGFMKREEIDQYYDEWKSFAVYSDGGDYIDLFKQSYAMITDCGSFLTEYFVSENPLIHLVSDKFIPNQTISEIDKTYYTACTPEELSKHLKDVILDRHDYKKNDRIKLLELLKLRGSSCSEKIINDILSDFT